MTSQSAAQGKLGRGKGSLGEAAQGRPRVGRCCRSSQLPAWRDEEGLSHLLTNVKRVKMNMGQFYCLLPSIFPIAGLQQPPGPWHVLSNIQAGATWFPSLLTCLSRERKGRAHEHCSGSQICSCASKSGVSGETPLLQPKGGHRVEIRKGKEQHSSQ